MPETTSPISGAMFVVVAEVSYNFSPEWRQITFPESSEEQAIKMAEYLNDFTAPVDGCSSLYRNVRIAHCQYSELPDYNDIDPLV